MVQTRFSQRLSWLMKERKISGQKIGDAIGKSQKTISRYANGEVDPSNDVKNMIYRVIADISGIEEDATTEEKLSEQEWILKADFSEREIEIGEQDQLEDAGRFDCLKKVFEQLSIGAKNYYIQNIDKFHLIEEWEYDVMEIYHKLSIKQQEKFLQYIEPVNFNFSSMDNHNKIAAYVQMVDISKNRPILLTENSEENVKQNKNEELCDEWINKITELEFSKNSDRMHIPCYPDFIWYTPQDWYFMLRIQIFELNDKERYVWGEHHGDKQIGSKLYSILRSIEEGYF